MKRILGLDLGTNSIGWALVEIDEEKKIVKILGLGSRILSMDAGEIKTFESGGKLKSMAAQKTEFKTPRKLNERYLLRRDRLHCVLNILGALPKQYKVLIDFETEKGYRCGKFKKGAEPKLAYVKNLDGKNEFLFQDSYSEMVQEFKMHQPGLFKLKNSKEIKIPFDWTLYYLRKKAIHEKVSLDELSWIILSFNQKRGYEKTIGEDEKEQKEGHLFETFIGKVESVTLCDHKNDTNIYEIVLVDPDSTERRELLRYKEESAIQITEENDLKEVDSISRYNENGEFQDSKKEYTVNEIRKLKVEDVKFTDKSNQFEIVLETGWCKIETKKYFPKWKGSFRDFIVKTKYDCNGIFKGSDKARSIKSPEADDWTLKKLKTDSELSAYNANNQTVGVASYIYSKLLGNPNQKIKGDLVTVIDRKYYKAELEAIFECQKKYHEELKNEQLFKQAVSLLYPNNETHRRQLEKLLDNDEILPFSKLITDDVLLYQRDLKSKKSLISNCNYEKRFNKVTREEVSIKVVPKSNPYYQEFRIWQFIKRLKIIKKEGFDENGIAFINRNVSDKFLTKETKENLFEFLNNREYITQSVLLKFLFGKEASNYLWNYDPDHKEPCNETRYNFKLRLNRVEKGLFEKLLSPENEYRLWHFFYSVKKRNEFVKGIETLFRNILIKEKVSLDHLPGLVANFKTFTGYASDYCSYSEKALKKLLPFLRIGKYWSKESIETILEKCNHEINQKVLSKEGIQGEIEDFQGLWISSACYLVYGRYSEVGNLQYWKSPYDIEKFLRIEFKQHSLNNPVVEKVLVETLNVVKDIWMHFGNELGVDDDGRKVYDKLFDRIHVELGREMKKNMKERKTESTRNVENKKTNERIIELLKELKRDCPDIKPKSKYQQERLRIIENDLLSSIKYDKGTTEYDFKNANGKITQKEIQDFVKKDVIKIKKSELERYRLWLEQRYQSPYTGKYIKLSDLFNREKYEIEHVFPQERITLDAQYNKVISETEVNKIKGAKTGYQFIVESNGTKRIYCSAHGREIDILDKTSYEMLVEKNFAGRKKEILLSQEIPDSFTNSQLNNARYISKMAMKLLSNIVREDGEDDFRSKHVLPLTGMVTTQLKKDWRLNDAWNKLIQPRFVRLNELTNSNLFGSYENIDGHDVFINRVPEELEKDFEKKRIDHRHHAMDALTVALATQNHVNYLNNIYSSDGKSDSKSKLVYRQQLKGKLTEIRKNKKGEKTRYFLPPAQQKEEGVVKIYSYSFGDFESVVFNEVAFKAFQNTIASFKQKKHLIRQRSNSFNKWNEKQRRFENEKQENLNKRKNYNVRQKLHKDTFYGEVKLKQEVESVDIIEAIEKMDYVVDFRIKEKIQNLLNENYTKEQVRNKLKDQYRTIEVYTEQVATRFGNFLEKFAEIEPKKILSKIDSITDRSVRDILFKHLTNYNSIERNVSDAVKFIDILVSEVVKVALREKLKEKMIIDSIDVDGKRISKVDVFTKTLKLTEEEQKNTKHNPQLAFSPDGVNELNKNIKELNGGKDHKPIYKVRLYETKGKMFSVSDDIGNSKNKKIVTTADGSNFYCGVYENNKTKDRKYLVPTLRETIENLKTGNLPCPQLHPQSDKNNEYQWLFDLIPNDLVYVPTKDEIENETNVDLKNLTNEQKERVYKFRDGSINEKGGVQFNFMPANIASMIYKIPKDGEKYLLAKGKQLKGEITLTTDKDKSQNTIETDALPIRKYCWKLKVDRLGNILGKARE